MNTAMLLNDLRKIYYSMEDCAARAQVLGLIKDCEMELKTKPLSVSDKSRLAALRKFLKVQDAKKAFQYTCTIDGKQYCTNGYAFVELNQPLPLEESPLQEDRDKLADFVKSYLPYLQKDAERAKTAVDLPAMPLLKEAVKRLKKEKAFKTSPIRLGETPVHCNAEYLQIMLTALGATACRVAENDPVKPIYFETEYGRGILLPVRVLGNSTPITYDDLETK